MNWTECKRKTWGRVGGTDAWALTLSSIPACNLPAEPLFFRKYLLSSVSLAGSSNYAKYQCVSRMAINV